MPEFQKIAADKATTMGHIKRLHLDDAKVQVPPDQVLRELDEALGPLWQRAVAAEVEALTVEALRDVLLPELLSGRLRVNEAEMVAEAVT
jgi:type I restriction enzyme S subunit